MGKNKSAKETFSISGSSSRAKPAPLQDLSYTAGINFPPSREEEDEEWTESSQGREKAQYVLPVISDKKLKKLESQETSALHAAETAKTEALKEDHDAFNVVIRSKTSGEETRDANVKDITIKSFSVSVQGKQLLNNTSLIISHGRRYGLVGPNGKGKSTLLKLLAWSKLPVPKNTDILLVEQELAGDDKTAVEAVVSANEELVKLREEASALQESSSSDDTGEKLAELYEKLELLGSDAAEAQASKILSGLGFTKEMQVRSTKSFSGGWRMRVSLAGALFVRPTLLLLDEPTNHLDLRAVLWLEEYLCRWKNTLVVVSHGLDFLNTVCTDIIHLEDQKLNLYRGNFDAFEKQYGQLRKEAIKKCLSHEKQRIKAANNQEKDNAFKRKGKGKGKEEEEEGTAPQGPPKRWRDYSVKLTFPEPTELAPPLLQLLEVSFSYPERGDFKLSDVDLGIDMGTRVVIVGPNGAGKSTLLNLVAGGLVPIEGEVRRSQNLKVGRYSQHFVDQLKMEETPVNYLLRLHLDLKGDQKAARAKLGKFGLQGNNQITPIAMLSGGQKARVVLASISMMKPHILLLDEPTNHMDMQTIDALGDALDGFKGGVVLVSHDTRLISRVCEDEEKSEIWVVKDGTVTFFQGTFEEYKEELKREIKAEVDELS